MKVYFLIAAFMLTSLAIGQKDPLLQKADTKLTGHYTIKDTALISDLTKASTDSSYSNTYLGLLYAQKGLDLSRKLEYPHGEVNAYLAIAVAKIYSNQYDSSLNYTNRALKLAKKNNLEEDIISCYDMRGSVHSYMGKYDLGVKDYLKAASIAEKRGSQKIIKSYSNLGFAYSRVGNIQKAEHYLMLSVKAGKKHNQPNSVASSLNNLGLIEKNKGNFDKAIDLYFEGLKYAEINDFKARKSELLYNISVVYFDQKKYELAIEYFDQSLEISKSNGSYLSIAINQMTLGQNFFEMGRKKEGWELSEASLEYALLSRNYEVISECYKQLAELSYQLKNFEDAYGYLSYAHVYKDSLQLAAVNDAISNTEHQYEQEKRELQISLERAQEKKISEEKLKWRDLLLWISFATLFVVALGVYLLMKSNRKIKQKSEMVELQKSEIEGQHREISDSILYAQRIQQAILANPEQFHKLSSKAFAFFRPKDVISGDFYWIFNDDESQTSIWAVGDCTGHGVPGALMSMLGIGLLNEIVIEGRERDPGQILNQLRRKIIQALENESLSGANDGMDIALCVLNKNGNELLYAGANNQLWMIQKDQSTMLEMAPDKMPVGKGIYNPPPFSTKKITVQQGDSIILCTDGFPDQFGGPANKKYKYKQLKDLLLSLVAYPEVEREKLIASAFDAWKGNEEQTDDVCLFWVTVES